MTTDNGNDLEVVKFGFRVVQRDEVWPKVYDALSVFVGSSFNMDDWVFEVNIAHNGYNGLDKNWSVAVTAGYIGTDQRERR